MTDCCREEGNESDLCGVEPKDSLFKGGSLLPDVEPWDESVCVHFTHVYVWLLFFVGRHSEGVCAPLSVCIHALLFVHPNGLPFLCLYLPPLVCARSSVSSNVYVRVHESVCAKERETGQKVFH